MNKPKILYIDIETAPIMSEIWSIWNVQNVGLNQIRRDWFLLSYAAKWDGDSKIFYRDQRGKKNKEDDKVLLQEIWNLLDQADIICGHNVRAFDLKKINSRFALAGMSPPSSYRIVDTLSVSRKHFSFTSYKLEFLSKKLCKKYKKLSHSKFPGHSLWTECLKDNKHAWQTMQHYNVRDVLTVEELYKVLKKWDNSINYAIYNDDRLGLLCSCGSKQFKRNGFAFTNFGKYQRFCCKKCNREQRDRTNLLSLKK